MRGSGGVLLLDERAGEGAELVATGASSPAVSPDGGTLAYVVFTGPGPGDPDPRLVLRNVATGDEVVFSGTEVPLHFVSDGEWTADGSEVVFTAGEINTALYAVDRHATSMAEAGTCCAGTAAETPSS